MTRWTRLDPTKASSLTAARLDAHFAAQVPAALGTTVLPPQDDAGHTNLGWDKDLDLLVGHPVQGLRAGLDIGGLSWVLLRDQRVLARQSATGLTVDQGLTWLRTQAAAQGLPDQVLHTDGYDLPDDKRGKGGPLGASRAEARAGLQAWFAAAADLLAEVAQREDGAGPLRCWPHHFDIATLITLDGRGEDARTVGVGLSPGDGGIDQPYFYVNPWPRPGHDDGPELPVGRWHVQGWFGAVLHGSEVPQDQPRAFIRRFLDAAIPAAKELAQG